MATINNFPNNADAYIGADNVMKWLHGRTSGVFGAENNLAVTAVAGQTAVDISDGIGWLANDAADGTVFWNDAEKTTGSKLRLTPEMADAVLPRIDRVVVQWATTDYVEKPEILILKGTATGAPVPPALTNNNVLRQISLAKISLPAGTSSLTDANITDERPDASVCGIVTDSVSVDTTTMQAQFSDFLARVEAELKNLNTGTEAMLRTQYDPTDAGLSFADLAATKTALGSVTAALPASGWSADAPYTQTVAVAGMTADRSFGPPFVRPTGNRETDEAAKEALACIGGGSTAAGTVTFYCYDAKPEADLTVTMQGVM